MAYYIPESAYGKKFVLKNGMMMPAVGLSTFRVRSEAAVHAAVDNALIAGYRLFDTADMYSNEVALRNAFATLLPKHDLERSDLFITSKLICIDKADYGSIKQALQRTLMNLGLDYLDLYLVNLPMVDCSERKRFWHNVQYLYQEGYVSAIGVSNYKIDDLREITSNCSAPMVNQVEWHPLNHNDELYNYCMRHDIVLQAYSPLGSPFVKKKRLLTHSVIKKMAYKYEVPTSQVLLMWSLQQKVAVLPFSTKPEHLYDNNHMDLVLSARDIKKISDIVPDPYSSDAEL